MCPASECTGGYVCAHAHRQHINPPSPHAVSHTWAQVHEPLNFDTSSEENANNWRGRREFGIWSVAFSGDGKELIAGTNDSSVYVYDLQANAVLCRVEGHDDDVNAVSAVGVILWVRF